MLGIFTALKIKESRRMRDDCSQCKNNPARPRMTNVYVLAGGEADGVLASLSS